ncbi:hypothetical protein COX24_01800 [bacterium (Candidatus Gribaldobacteria) CG23_combo_of_CG06-09_8_20_14_all_37_87_8]|uniref:Uncharacterized protein n=1 Tax=bacterium (Candidatus Gribaldobacteria) CG23_combo_of_CG06-09_8_20_14_all_37_87_8 TaxID=2014278 RepID=A0A2G9ZGS1_9BACT|nr:MAG: hypothetical protein COX24_01800 [bacterium (Candidatus Gribaldobacteria) CG23_combo_of_CG06-09_8_20_14_all_37_87_8]
MLTQISKAVSTNITNPCKLKNKLRAWLVLFVPIFANTIKKTVKPIKNDSPNFINLLINYFSRKKEKQKGQRGGLLFLFFNS